MISLVQFLLLIKPGLLIGKKENMSRIVLYHSPYSPFSRSVLLCCRFLKLDVEVKILDLMLDEQSSPEFLKINPQHCVPTIDDDGFYLWESRAILNYLIDSRAPQLIPTSREKRAIVNQRLYLEMGGLGKIYADLYVNISLKYKKLTMICYENVSASLV